MISKVRRLAVSKCAEDLVTGLQIAALPIDPIRIALDRGITVQSWKPKKQGVSGFLMKQGNAFGISYSSFITNQGFINFTVGHELGHFFLPGHVDKIFAGGAPVHYSNSGFVSNDDCEKEADLFSATLLMPDILFRKATRACGEGFEAIEKLANSCITSITATAIRYAEFSEDPVAVILSEGGRVQFCCLSDVLRERQGLTWLKRGDSIPDASTTARFQSVPENIASGAKANAFAMLDEWFDGAPHIEMKEDVVGLGNYGKTLTVLFTDQDIEESDEEDYGWKPRWER
jgi:hypothetical protein